MPLEQTCSNCSAALPLTAKFCPQCGHTVTIRTAAEARGASPQNYTPSHLADQILASKSVLEGERKLVTVLFCDIVESSGLAKRLGPEAMHELLDLALQLMAGAVHRYEGTVNQFLGDGIMALFGAPVALENHARRAVEAAVEIRDAIAGWSEQLKRDRGIEIRLRMALNTGLVVVGKIGDKFRTDYTAVGDTTNVAAHLEQGAEAGTILLSEATYRLVNRDVRVEVVEPIRIKGKPEPVPAYRVIGLGPWRSALERHAKSTLSEFVGRERELAVLHDLLGQVERGRGQLVGLVGEPGVGKSRLLLEFRRKLGTTGVDYVEGHCLSYATAMPYLPAVDIIRSQCGISDADTPTEVVSKVRGALAVLGIDPEERAPYVLWLLGVKEGTDRLDRLGPEAIKERTFDTLRQFSLRLSQRRPIIVVLEDLQWIDKTSEELFAFLADGLAGAPMLVISTYRPGYRPPWLAKSYASQIALPPLSRDESLRLVHSALQTEHIPDDLARLILSRAEGNPLFLEELARVVREHSGLLPMQAVPDTVQAVLMARIDRLPDRAKQLLQTASVLGREFSLRLVASIWADEGDVTEHLLELIRREFLYEQTGVQEVAYAFTHALTQEVAYEGMLTARRQALHAATGRALETLYAGRLEEVYDRLAYHYSKAEETDKAIEYLTRFAHKVVRGHSHTEAVAALTEALVHAERLPVERRDTGVLDLVLRQVQSFNVLGRNREILDLLLRQRERVERLRDPSRSARYYFSLGITHGLLGDQERADESLQRSVDAAKQCGDERTMGRAYALQTLHSYWSGRGLQGIEYGRLATAILERTQQRYFLGLAYFYVATVHYMLGEFQAALAAATKAKVIGETLEHSNIQSYARLMVGFIQALTLDCDSGIAECRRALELSPDPLTKGLATGILGYAHLQREDAALAIRLLEDGTRTMHQFGYRQNHAFFIVGLAEAYLLDGQTEKARDLASHGLRVATEAKFTFGMGVAQRALGRIGRTSGDLLDAEAYLAQAVGSFESILGRFELARTHVDLALLARARHDQQRAAAHFTEADRRFRALQLEKHVERTTQLAKESGGQAAH